MWFYPRQRWLIHPSICNLCLLQTLHSLRTLILTCFWWRWLWILNISPSNFDIIIQALFRKIFCLSLWNVHCLIIGKLNLCSLFFNSYLMIARLQSQQISFVISLNFESSTSILDLIKCLNIIHYLFGSFFIWYCVRHSFVVKIVTHSCRGRYSNLRLRLAGSQNFLRLNAIQGSLGTRNFNFESFYFLGLDFLVSSFNYF